MPGVPSPLYYNGRLYTFPERRYRFLSGGKDRRAGVQRAAGSTGLLLLIASGGRQKIYIASAEGVVVVLDAGDKLNILATNKLDGAILATPALVDGNIYVRTDSLPVRVWKVTRAFGDRRRAPRIQQQCRSSVAQRRQLPEKFPNESRSR